MQTGFQTAFPGLREVTDGVCAPPSPQNYNSTQAEREASTRVKRKGTEGALWPRRSMWTDKEAESQ